MNGAAKPLYRPDIDGLRAIAVVPVLLYHAGVPGFGGGFIGVDIFFVISGFLITGIIAREVDAGKFSIVHFYERRARRILPALSAMIGFVLIMASWLYLPGDFEGVPASALAALGFLANVWFFSQAGYFQSEAETMPLLHTWSLGVEEQFYIGLPVMLLLIARYAPHLRLPAVIALTGLSFLWAFMKQAIPDGFAFYLLPPRAWELLAGALLALGAVPEIRHRLACEAISLAGLAAIVAAVVLYKSNTVFPGVAALPPVLGAAALIHCGQGTMAGKALSLRLPVAIGLISYSLYLWHWPLIVFTGYRQGMDLRPLQSAAVIAASLAAAWLSWRFIERPFRDHRRFDVGRIFRWSAGSMLALSAAGLMLISLGGWSERFPAATVRLAAAKSDFSPARTTCFSDQLGADLRDCTHGAKTAPASLIWGDSHGIELAWALGERLGQRGQSIAQRTMPSCPPALGFDPAGNRGCAEHNQRVMDEIEGNPDIRTIYLAGFWASENYRDTGVLGALDAAITRLAVSGRRVVLIGPVPRQKFEVPRRLAIGGPEIATASRREYFADTEWFTDQYSRWQAQGVQTLDPAKVLVKGEKTVIVAGGHPLYFDSHHLSVTGAERVLDAYPDL
jgi:peptidoglycan/LPS O-acetylase OafA/YrhL